MLARDTTFEGKHFAAKTGHGSFEKIFCMRFAVLDRVCDALEVLHRDRTRPIEAVRNPDWMDATIKEGFTLL
jgi:hypothetical protein